VREVTAVFAVGRALWLALATFWAILWQLILGFALSGIIQAFVSKRQMARVLGDDHPTTVFRKGAKLHRGDGIRARSGLSGILNWHGYLFAVVAASAPPNAGHMN
jgi:hypothetical protein